MKKLLLRIALTLSAGAATAQPAPDAPLHLVVPFAVGGATDAIGRVVGKRVSELTGQTVIVENKPGAGGTIGIDYAARATPDTPTVVLVNALQHTSSAKLYPHLRYDALKSFQPIASIGTVRYMLLVNAEGAPSYEAFVQQARGRPGQLSYASAGIGSAPHLVMELFARSQGLRMVHVPYGGSGPAMNDLVAGHVQVAMDNVAAVPLIKAGRLRALAITGSQRAPAFPDVPTFAEAGAKGFDVIGVWGFLAPASMPAKAAERLGDAIGRAMKDPQVAEALAAQGVQADSGSGARFGAVLREEAARWSKLIDDAQIRL